MDFNLVKNEFKLLSQKDKDIDAKLENSGIVKFKKYPEGWD